MLRCACIGWSGVGWGGLITFIRLRSSVCIFQYALEATLLTWSSNFQHDLDAMLLAGSWNFLYDLDATLLTYFLELSFGVTYIKQFISRQIGGQRCVKQIFEHL